MGNKTSFGILAFRRKEGSARIAPFGVPFISFTEEIPQYEITEQ